MCTVTISTVNGILAPNATDPSQLQITGTFQNCAANNVLVTVKDSTNTVIAGPSLASAINANLGQWAAVLNISAGSVKCGAALSVEAHCAWDATCHANLSLVSLTLLECPGAGCDRDFTYLKVIDWGWFYLSTILDDFSRYIIAWKLCTTMNVGDVTQTLDLALQASGVDRAKVVHRPRLLSDNGPSYISAELAEWLDERNMGHVRGAPCHPQTQGKIERWHQTLKNRILLENYYLPGDLEAQIGRFVDHYNHRRYHESLSNLTPADVYFGRAQTILLERERIKRDTIRNRRLQHQRIAA